MFATENRSYCNLGLSEGKGRAQWRPQGGSSASRSPGSLVPLAKQQIVEHSFCVVEGALLRWVRSLARVMAESLARAIVTI